MAYERPYKILHKILLSTSLICLPEITNDKVSTQKPLDGVNYHPWRIENKYYCAEVKFLVVANHNERPDWLTKNEMQFTAVVILFDQIQSSFEEAKEWLPDVESQDASVLLLVGSKSQQTVTDDGEKKDTSSLTSEVLQFSIKHSFEFIDLNEEIDPEDDFPDTVGFPRIVQALHATEWPDLEMKGQATTTTRDLSSNEDTKAFSENKTAEEIVSQNETFHDMFDGIMDEADMDSEPSFDKLFSQMKLMKEKAESLPHSERKAYAEQVAVAFWNAIGGDEDEIEGLGLFQK
ncbi:Hypothetical predicted protein [Paramuricea clavata]|uniref:Uncharacterized protein n=1 Tax=Paramuricea clavata TaxID=317549 RepID=A0A6S7GAZ9_PARCT|nr:Hypothetical predicted protein [Paramuricea clavata]